MAKRKTTAPSLARSADPLYQEIRAVLESARAGAYRAVNAAMVQAYWNVGRLPRRSSFQFQADNMISDAPSSPGIRRAPRQQR